MSLYLFADLFEKLATEHYGLVPSDDEEKGYRRSVIPKFKRGNLVKMKNNRKKLYVFLSYKHWSGKEEKENYQPTPQDYEAETLHPDLECIITEVEKVKRDGKEIIVPVGRLYRGENWSFKTVNVAELEIAE